METNVYHTLEQRGFIEAVTSENLSQLLATQKVTVYAGFDPTSDSLHVGHLLPIMALAHFHRLGHRIIVLTGGATGMIGDPSGRSTERNLLSREDVMRNAEAIHTQLRQLFERMSNHTGDILFLNNYDWLGKIHIIDWLRDIGKLFNVHQMLQKESVKLRMQTERGISYTEFSYSLLQSYDFLYLAQHYDCTLQIGGSDQWGNITSGMDLCRKVLQREVHGITFPLITTASGEKLGKSAGNAIWLHPDKTSPYHFYQYWINLDDKDVERFLKFFTFLSIDQIQEIVAEHWKAPHLRLGQKRLAAEVTRLIHGDNGLKKAIQATEVFFGGSLEGLTDKEILDITAHVPSTEVSKEELEQGISILNLLQRCEIVRSRSEGRRLISGGGAYLNNCVIKDPELVVNLSHLEGRQCLLLRSGKKNYHLVRIV